MFYLLIVGLLLILCVIATPGGTVVGYRTGRTVAFRYEEYPRLVPIVFAAAGFVIRAVCSLLCLRLAVSLIVGVNGGV